MWLIAGLGNPGAQYQGTRHNIGFAVLDSLTTHLQNSNYLVSNWNTKFSSSFCEASTPALGKIYLIRPEQYMNLSGMAVQAFQNYFKIPVSNIIVIHDEADLPLGVLRIKVSGGDGGHNGIKSIINQLGSKDFIRIRVGIGKPEQAQQEQGISNWVLGKFTSTDNSIVQDVLKSTCSAVTQVIEQGVSKAQMIFNKNNVEE